MLVFLHQGQRLFEQLKEWHLQIKGSIQDYIIHKAEFLSSNCENENTEAQLQNTKYQRY